jgi:hypothetical protein
VFCQLCGTKNPPQNHFCTACGTPLIREFATDDAKRQAGIPPPPAYFMNSQIPTPSVEEFAYPLVNNSGAGPQRWAPREVNGWTFAGFVGFGLFAFFNGIIIWGVIGLLCSIIPYIGCIGIMVYWVYIGINGRKLAWQSRRFESLKQYKQVMAAWDTAGGVLFSILVFIALVGIAVFISELNSSSSAN